MNHAIEAQYPFKCSTPLQLRFNDVDALGHVNNSVYFQFFDLGKTQYFKGLNVQADIDWRRRCSTNPSRCSPNVRAWATKA